MYNMTAEQFNEFRNQLSKDICSMLQNPAEGKQTINNYAKAEATVNVDPYAENQEEVIALSCKLDEIAGHIVLNDGTKASDNEAFVASFLSCLNSIYGRQLSLEDISNLPKEDIVAMLENPTPEIAMGMAGFECRSQIDNANEILKTGEEEHNMEPVTQQEVSNQFSSDSDDEDFEFFKKYFDDKFIVTPHNRDMQKHKEEAAKKPEKPNKMQYKKDTVEVNGNPMTFTRYRKDMSNKCDFSDLNTFGSIEKLRDIITDEIKEQFGDWSRIQTIHIVSEQLIINGACFMPVVNASVVGKLPLDTKDYIQNGCIASLFRWDNLRRMTRLHTFTIDDGSFYTNNIASDLGWHKDATYLFKVCKSLENLVIAGDNIGINGKYVESTANYKRKEANRVKWNGIFDGYKIDVYSGTNSFQSFAFNNLKNYASNRNNKGLLRYLLGIGGRAGVATFAGATNLGVHLIGGVFKGIAKGFKQAVTPITPEDI